MQLQYTDISCGVRIIVDPDQQETVDLSAVGSKRQVPIGDDLRGFIRGLNKVVPYRMATLVWAASPGSPGDQLAAKLRKARYRVTSMSLPPTNVHPQGQVVHMCTGAPARGQ